MKISKSNKGVPKSLEHRKKLSEYRLKNRELYCGSNNSSRGLLKCGKVRNPFIFKEFIGKLFNIRILKSCYLKSKVLNTLFNTNLSTFQHFLWKNQSSLISFFNFLISEAVFFIVFMLSSTLLREESTVEWSLSKIFPISFKERSVIFLIRYIAIWRAFAILSVFFLDLMSSTATP